MRSGTSGPAGGSLACETFDRFADQAKSFAREVALGAAHVRLTLTLAVKFPICGWRTLVGVRAAARAYANGKISGERAQGPPPTSVGRLSCKAHPESLGPAGAQAVRYGRTCHQTCA